MSPPSLLERLREDERRWLRFGRWQHLVTGAVAVGGNGYILYRWHSLMRGFAEIFDGSSLPDAASTVYAMGLIGVGTGAFFVYGLYEVVTAIRHWNGDPVRQGVIACLASHATAPARP